MTVVSQKERIHEMRNLLLQQQRKIQLRKVLGNRSLLIGAIILFIMVLIAVLAPVISPYDPNTMNVPNRLMPPSSQHFLGTDEFGRDLLTRIMYGSRVSMFVGLVVSLLSSAVGLVIGLYASYYKVLDHILMRISDGLIAIPGILLAIALMAALGASIWNVVISLTVVFTPSIARVVRASAIVVREQPYVEAVYMQGAGPYRILWGNIAPNVLSPLFIQATFIFASAILSEAALSFLGAGIPAPEASWGNILQASKLVINKAWWVAVFPGVILILSVLSLNLLGDGLRDHFDPHTGVRKQ